MFLTALNWLAGSQGVSSLAVWEFVFLVYDLQDGFRDVSKRHPSAGLCAVSVSVFRL